MGESSGRDAGGDRKRPQTTKPPQRAQPAPVFAITSIPSWWPACLCRSSSLPPLPLLGLSHIHTLTIKCQRDFSLPAVRVQQLAITLAAIEISLVAIISASSSLAAPCQIPLARILDSIHRLPRQTAAPARPPARARTRLFFVVAGPWSHFVFSRFFREV